MTNRPLISVIVPIYGIERYLGICIESIICQTYQNLEIILVDDGSPDRCSEICDLYAKKDKRIKVIHKANGGLVSARKAGIAAASGEFVGYVDGDDWIKPTFYESLYSAIGDADLAVAGQTRVLFDNAVAIRSNVPAGEYAGDKLASMLREAISCGEFYKPGITTYVWNKLFRKDLLEQYQLAVNNAITIGEDAAVVYPLLSKCRKIVVIDNFDYCYRQREDSMLKKSRPFSEEAKGLALLYNYLIGSSMSCTAIIDYQAQVRDFVLGLAIMRSGGLSVGNNFWLPYPKDFKGSRVIIYSAGTFGQQLVNRIKEHDYCDIVKWVDSDYWEYRRCCLDVDSENDIRGCEFDYVVIATINSALYGAIKKRLIDDGVEAEKILSVECPLPMREMLIKQYLG